jgi:putrescine aminotransferase
MQQDPEELARQTLEQYRQFMNPGLASLLRFMGLDAVEWEGEGAVVRDAAGNEYLDFLGGYGAFNLGHRHPAVVAAVREQLDRLPLSSKILLSKPAADLAQLLCEVAPKPSAGVAAKGLATPPGLERVFFCNSGAEAVEGSLKLARASTGRKKFVAAIGGFHGKTLGALSVCGRDVYRKPFEPLLADVSLVPFGDAAALEAAIDSDTAAVILEPIQGEGGVNIPPDGYLPQARRLCDQAGCLLILDEVQTGLGRTGFLFECQRSGVAPDIMALAKSLGGGVMPLGAFMAKASLWRPFEENPLLHSSTFGGNSLACAAGLAAVKTIIKEKLPQQAAEKGSHLMHRLADIKSEHADIIADVRGRGLMIGVEFRDSDFAALVIAGLARRRILAAYTLNNPKVLRLQPPLIVSREQLGSFLTAFSESLQQAKSLVVR